MRPRRRSCEWAIAAALLLPAGCGAPVLSMDDVVVLPGRAAQLAAYVEHEGPLGMRRDIPGVQVRFYASRPEVEATTRTDSDGLAEAHEQVRPTEREVLARARVGGRDLRATGRVFAWDPARVAIAVDIDQTIADTQYKELLLDEDDPSHPLKHSVDVLRQLARDFQLVYFTGRPRFLLEKTRGWLREHEFPDGPVIVARGTREMLHVASYKRQQLGRLRKSWPNLLIGIGDKPGDAAAYGANGMLAVCLARSSHEYGLHTVRVRDWRALGRFFEANREVLCDERAVRDVIAGRRMLLCPVGDYKED